MIKNLRLNSSQILITKVFFLVSLPEDDVGLFNRYYDNLEGDIFQIKKMK